MEEPWFTAFPLITTNVQEITNVSSNDNDNECIFIDFFIIRIKHLQWNLISTQIHTTYIEE